MKTRKKYRTKEKHSNCAYRRLCFSLLLFLFLFSFGCQEEIAWELQEGEDIRLVVLGRITNERRMHEVHLFQPAKELNGKQQPVLGAEVYVSDGDSRFEFSEDTERPGYYLSDPGFQGVINKTYTLHINADGYDYTARAEMVAVAPIADLSTYKVSQDPALYEVAFGSSEDQYRIILEMDWSDVEGYEELSREENHAILYGYNFGRLTVDVNMIFSPAKERVPFPPGTHVIITKESLSEGYAEYLRGMVSETTWNGGLFDVKPGNPYTNLSEGAVGYFAATTVVRDTVVFWP